MAGFALASLLPVVMLGLGAALGGLWFGLALVYTTGFMAMADRLVAVAAPDAPEGAEFPAANVLLIALALAHLALLPVAVFAVAGGSSLSGAERMTAFFAFGLFFGQIANPAAHELIHRGDRRLHDLGVAIYVTLLFGHHASAHRHVHHRHVASQADPNTARRGESFYVFAPRAWAGSFRAGLAAENARRGGLHPYIVYVGGAAVCLTLAFALAGAAGLAAYLALASYATAQLLLSDYVQHYGLSRARLPDGRLEPVSERHSWNAAHPASAAMMLNAARHSDHHAHPARPYPALRLRGTVPLLPRSLPVMGVIALCPPLWRRVMHPRLAALTAASRECDLCRAGTDLVDLAG